MNRSADAARVKSKLRSEVPGKEKEYEKKGEAMAHRAGQQLDRAVSFLSVDNPIWKADLFDSRLTMHGASSPRRRQRPKKSKKRPAKRRMKQLTTSTRRWNGRQLKQRLASAAG